MNSLLRKSDEELAEMRALLAKSIGKGKGLLNFQCSEWNVSIEIENNNVKHKLYYNMLSPGFNEPSYHYSINLPFGEYRYTVYNGIHKVAINKIAVVTEGEVTNLDVSPFVLISDE
jgi:hypothetical protein